MQIAIRDDQARTLPQAGTRGSAAAASVHSFDDLVRALGARQSLDDARPIRDDRADRGDRREPVRTDETPRDDYVRADRPATESEAPARETEPARTDASPDGTGTAEAEPTTDAEPSDGQTPPADGKPAATEQEATGQEATTGQAAATEATAETPATAAAVAAPAVEQIVAAGAPKQTLDASGKPAVQPAATAAAAASATPAATTNSSAAAAAAQPQEAVPQATEPTTPGAPSRESVRPAMLADAATPSQVQPASAKSGGTAATATQTTAAPETPVTLQGLTSVLLAQAMVARPASPQGTAANGAQQANGALQKAIGKAINVNQAELGARGEEHRQLDFKSIAAALFNQSPTAHAAPKTASGESASVNGSTTAATGTPTLGERATPTAQANGASAPAHAARTAAPQLSERIGMTIVRAAESGVDQVSIRLNPRELGRIDVRMEMGQDGRLNLSVSADRQETLDQLQRNGRDLERALSDAGFDTGAGDLSFSLRDRQAQAQQDEGGAAADGDDEELPELGAKAGEDGMIVTHNDGSLMVVDLFV